MLRCLSGEIREVLRRVGKTLAQEEEEGGLNNGITAATNPPGSLDVGICTIYKSKSLNQQRETDLEPTWL